MFREIQKKHDVFIPNLCLMQYLDNVELSSREEYTVTKLRSVEPPALASHRDQLTCLVFLYILVEFQQNRGIE